MTDCPHLDSFVRDSRPHPDGSVRRRRECQRCGHRWATREISEDTLVGLVDAVAAARRRGIEEAAGVAEGFRHAVAGPVVAGAIRDMADADDVPA